MTVVVGIYNWYLTGYWKVIWIGSIILWDWGIGKLCWWKVSKVVIGMLKRIVIIAWHWVYGSSRDDNWLIGQSTVIYNGQQIWDCDQQSPDLRQGLLPFWFETDWGPSLGVEYQGCTWMRAEKLDLRTVYEIYNNDCMDLEIGWWSYRCGNWLRGFEWYLESRKDGIDLFWMWQRLWNDKWIETEF